MKCPNCEGVMPGSAVVCKSCGHRLTQASIEKWRTERAQPNQTPVQKESDLAAKMRARFAEKRAPKPEANLIQFPVSPNAPIHNLNTASKQSAEPAWRERIKASVHTHRTRQTPNALETEIASLSVAENPVPSQAEVARQKADADAAQLLLVESALKRIRRVAPSSVPAPAAMRSPQPAISYPSAQSQALALMEEAERFAEAKRQDDDLACPAPAPAPKPAPKVTETARPLPRQRKFTAANLALQVDEDPYARPDEQNEAHPLNELPLTAENLPSFSEETEALASASAAEKLRVKAALYAEANAVAEEPEAEATPWVTDAEAAEHKGQEIWLGKPAPIWMRTLAGICDLEAAAMLYLPFFGAYYTMGGELNTNDYLVMGLMVIVVMYLYQLVTFTLNGRTFGMAIFGMRNFDVEKANAHISFKRRALQALGGTVALLCPPFNLIITRLTGFERGFGDALAKTVTLRRAQE